MKLRVPANVTWIIDILRRHGFEAYAVGGCVRDSILARNPNDWDITTSARPEEIKKIFRRTVDTGIEHGTVTVLMDKESYEVTTFRIDGKYSDGRHPDTVTFTPSLKEDLKRRDFTINAMAYNEKLGLIDIYGGMDDLQRHVIRCVGDPNERFDEDALRILRAVRFAAQLGFSIDPATLEAIRTHAEMLRNVSAERIQVELVKLLTSPNPMMFRVLYETGITKMILPEFDACMETEPDPPHQIYSVGEHILHTLPIVPEDKALRLTMLLHDIGKAGPAPAKTDPASENAAGNENHAVRPTRSEDHAAVSAKMAKDILRRLKFDNATIDKVTRLVRCHSLKPGPTEPDVRRAIHTVGKDLFNEYLMVQRADNCAKAADYMEEQLTRIEEVNLTYIRILGHRDPLTLKELAIDGNDLMAAGFRGREIGEILERSLFMVLNDPSLNDKAYLLGCAKRDLLSDTPEPDS